MKVKVIYQKKVLDDGMFIVGARVLFTEPWTINENEIEFSLDCRPLTLSNFRILSTNEVQVVFKEPISMLKFNLDKFINEEFNPNILMYIKGLPLDTHIDIDFQEDSFLSEFVHRITQEANLQFSYAIYDSKNNNKKRPLVIFLHGSGERGSNNNLPLIGNDVVKTIYEYVTTKEDAVILVPQASWAPTLNGWFRKEYCQAVMQLIRKIVKDANIDERRIYLTGLSNGASATWHFAQHYPQIFAAIVPCSGYIFNDGKEFYGKQGEGRYMLPTSQEAKQLVQMPIWAFHAEDDPTVNVLGTIKAVAEIQKQGGNLVKCTIYSKGEVVPNAHASWSKAFNNKELLLWMFAQHK